MKRSKKWLAAAMTLVLGMSLLAGCGGNSGTSGEAEGGEAEGFDVT